MIEFAYTKAVVLLTVSVASDTLIINTSVLIYRIAQLPQNSQSFHKKLKSTMTQSNILRSSSVNDDTTK